MPELSVHDDLTGFVVGRDTIKPDERAEVWANWCNIATWKQAHGGDDYYRSLRARSTTSADRQQLTDAATIEADVCRTYTSSESHVFTINGVPNTDATDVVRRVLYAIALHGRDRNGYVQGMNYLVANLLAVTGDEELSFWLTVCVTDVLLGGYFDQQLRQFQVDSKAFRSLAGELCPRLYGQLQEHHIPVDVSLAKIYLCLFLQTFRRDQVNLLWDSLFFLQGDAPLATTKLALAILKFKEKALFGDNGADGAEGLVRTVTASGRAARAEPGAISVSTLILRLQSSDDCQANFAAILDLAFHDAASPVAQLTMERLNWHRHAAPTVARYECVSAECMVLPSPVLDVRQGLARAGSKLRSMLQTPQQRAEQREKDSVRALPRGTVVTATVVQRGWVQVIGGGWVKLRSGGRRVLQRIVSGPFSPRLRSRKRTKASSSSSSSPSASSLSATPRGPSQRPLGAARSSPSPAPPRAFTTTAARLFGPRASDGVGAACAPGAGHNDGEFEGSPAKMARVSRSQARATQWHQRGSRGGRGGGGSAGAAMPATGGAAAAPGPCDAGAAKSSSAATTQRRASRSHRRATKKRQKQQRRLERTVVANDRKLVLRRRGKRLGVRVAVHPRFAYVCGGGGGGGGSGGGASGNAGQRARRQQHNVGDMLVSVDGVAVAALGTAEEVRRLLARDVFPKRLVLRPRPARAAGVWLPFVAATSTAAAPAAAAQGAVSPLSSQSSPPPPLPSASSSSSWSGRGAGAPRAPTLTPSGARRLDALATEAAAHVNVLRAISEQFEAGAITREERDAMVRNQCRAAKAAMAPHSAGTAAAAAAARPTAVVAAVGDTTGVGKGTVDGTVAAARDDVDDDDEKEGAEGQQQQQQQRDGETEDEEEVEQAEDSGDGGPDPAFAAELNNCIHEACQFACETLRADLISKEMFQTTVDELLKVQRQNGPQNHRQDRALEADKENAGRGRINLPNGGDGDGCWCSAQQHMHKLAVVRDIVEQLAKVHPPQFVDV